MVLAPILAVGQPGSAQQQVGGHLLVTPTRLVLEGRTRSAEVHLLNKGKEPATYRIGLVRMVMDEQGRMTEQALTPEEAKAETYFRFSPRQVVLAPGASQAVRLQVRKPEGLATGEYRWHMVFRAVPPAAAAPEPAKDEPAPTGVSVDIRAIFGVSIPVIVRQGPTHAAIELTGLAIKPTDQGPPGHQFLFDLNRTGNQSVYGDLMVTWQPRDGQALPIWRMTGVAVYAELSRRTMKVRMPFPEGKSPRDGTLKVAFLEHGTTKVMAETALAIP